MISARKPARRRLAWLWAAGFILAVSPWTVSAERPPARRLLPETTVVLVSFADVPEMVERFKNTAAGRMGRDSNLKPLLGNLYDSLTEATAEMEQSVGLSLADLLAIPQGEVSVALVIPDEAQPAIVVLLDAGDQIDDARKLLELFMAEVDDSGGRYDEEDVAGTKIVIFDGPDAGQRTVLLEKDATIVVGTNVEVVKQLLAVWDGDRSSTIADVPNYRTIMQRCRGDGDGQPHLAWYLDPIGLMRGIGQNDAGVRVGLALLPVLGLDGLTAIGGSVSLDTEQFDSEIHAHILLAPSRTGIIKMIALESGDSEPEPWVPADVASYTTLNWNVEQTFKELAILYDSFNGEGALTELLQQRFLQPTGIDLENELLPGLEGRLTYISWFQRPMTPRSLALLAALKLNDTDVFDQALDRLFSLGAGSIAKETWAGRTYYQVQAPADLPANERPPTPCFGILDDYLLVTNHPGLYEKVVTTSAGRSESLSDDLAFKLIASRTRRQSGGNSPAMVSFSRPEETVRWLYDLIASEQTRQRLSQQAEEDEVAKALNTAFQENPLPPFRALRQYLAPGGAMLVNDQTGLHYMRFTLQRKSK